MTKRSCLTCGIILGILFVFMVSDGSCFLIQSKSRTNTSGRTIYVDDDFNDSTPGWNIDHFKTVSAGVAVSEPGDTVFVFNGLYHEGNVYINQTIILQGENAASTIIFGSPHENIFIVPANHVRICGFTMRMAPLNGIELLGNSNEVCDSILRENGGSGICILGNRNFIHDNIFNTNSGNGGIYVEYGNSNLIANNTFSHNDYGIKTKGARFKTLIEHNTLTQSRNTAIYLGYGFGTLVFGNEITSNPVGVFLYYTSNCLIIRNNIHENSINGCFERGGLQIPPIRWVKNFWGDNRWVEPIRGEICLLITRYPGYPPISKVWYQFDIRPSLQPFPGLT